jgi:hypothetical protein
MAREHSIRRYRRWYALLLRLYPQAYRERFGEGMEQTFHDLLGERQKSGGGLLGFVLWAFSDAIVAILGENMTSLTRRNITRRLRVWPILVAILLMVPLVAMQVTAEVKWSVFDFAFMGSLLLGTGLAYDFFSSTSDTVAYKVGAGLAVLAGRSRMAGIPGFL